MMHGFAVFALMAAAILLHSLIGDLHKWLTRTPEVAFASIPSPAELEAGAATRPHTPLDPEPGATGTAPFISPTSSETKISPALRAGLLVMTSLTFIYDFRQRKTVSLEKPLFDNVSAVLWYFLGGFEVLFVCFLLLVACKLRSRGAAGALQMQEQPAASIEPSVEVLFEEGTGPVPEATAKEKEYSDADKA
ncbi:hypothetical protein C8J57DRAFT_1725507 [Mycena rebaudengoi]|nr:hypothetical protein C8J57DRAFT_1725507 [Mycena rebaudengoi]